MTRPRGARQATAVSVIILARERFDDTRRCLASLWRSTPPGACEVLVFDNASSPRTFERLSRLCEGRPGVRLLRNPRNLGFAEGVNLGMRQARGRFLLWLNNDTVLAPGWLGGLLEAAESDPSIAAAGPMTNRMAPPAQLCRPFPTRPRTRVQEADFLGGFCLLLRRSAARAVGGLDERFAWGWEDVDYCLRLRQAGWRLAVARDVFVRHEGGRTLGAMPPSERNATDTANRELIRRKWSAEPWRRGLQGLFRRFPARWDRAVPEASVIVVCSDGRRARACLQGLRRRLEGPASEVIAVDATPDGSAAARLGALARGWPDLSVLGPCGDARRSAALNRGLRLAKGAWHILVDDDWRPRPGWLQASLEAAKSHPRVGLWTTAGGAAPLAPSGTAPPPRGRPRGWPRFYDPQACFLLPRSCHELVGGFDERFAGALCDADYRIRVFQAGLEVRRARWLPPRPPASGRGQAGIAAADWRLLARKWADPAILRGEVFDDGRWRAGQPWRPEVSIVVARRAGGRRMLRCLESVRRCAGSAAFEVIAVEAAAARKLTPELAAAAKAWPGLRVLGPWRSATWPHAVNKALEAATGRFYAVLSDDALVSPGWLEALLAAAGSAPNVGVAAPRTDASSLGWLQGDRPAELAPGRGAVKAGGRASRPPLGKVLADRGAGRVSPVSYVRDVCLLIPATAFARVGGFDERFRASLGGEDYCMRAAQAGYQVVVAEGAFVSRPGGRAGRGGSARREDASLLFTKWAGNPALSSLPLS
ncbi:MAG: glycosyltransferase [Elusimicrobia bacterium]|nr:glycosyltransferase [Elusimicrobiota bacterium]